MGNDWRFKLLFLLFAIIPATGAWHYARVYRSQTETRPISVAKLFVSPPEEISEFLLEDFTVSGQPTCNRSYEYVLARCSKLRGFYPCGFGESDHTDLGTTSGSDNAPEILPVVVLRRARSLDGTLAERLAEEVVQVTYAPRKYLTRKYANKIGLQVSSAEPDCFQIVDVDEQYFKKTLGQILWATLWLSGSGFGLLMYVLSHLDARKFKDGIRHDRVRAQVALNLAISKQEVSRY